MSFNFDTKERQLLYSFATNILKNENSKLILDVACGDGNGSVLIASAVRSAEVIGVDINIELFKEIKKIETQNLKFLYGDCRNLNFENEMFDTVVSFHTIEHLSSDDQRLFITEIKRVLKFGGIFLIATPDVDVWRLQGVAGVQKDHIKELTKKEFLDIVHNCGFIVKNIYGQGILKKNTAFLMRRVLNLFKKIDIFKLRKLIYYKIIDSIDTKTQPIELDFSITPLYSEEKASVVLLYCRKQ